MKTNMTDLMSRISQMQSDFDDLELKIRTNSTNTKIIELNGNEQVIEKSEDFEKNYNEYLRLSKIIPKLKGVLYKRNNTLMLPVLGITIQEALAEIQTLRTLLATVKALASKKPYKRRTTENTNSYFTSIELAYDKEAMQELEKDLIEQIQSLEFGINKLNSEEFEIDLDI